MTWWAFGFVCHNMYRAVRSGRQQLAGAKQIGTGFARVMTFALAASILFVVPLAGARWYQQRQVRRLLRAYIEAPKTPVLAAAGLQPNADSGDWPQYLEVDLNEAACGAGRAVTFRDSPEPVGTDFTRTITITRPTRSRGVTRIFQPVFEAYRGLELPDERLGCVVGAYRFTSTRAMPLLLGATLPPDWEALPLYQRLKDWEPDPFYVAPTFADLPKPSTWTLAPGVRYSRTLFGASAFVGDRSTNGYQVTSPRIQAAAGSRITVRTDLSVSRGRVCLGALNATASSWLAPASSAASEVSFTVDSSGGFIVTLANCNTTAMTSPTRFKLSIGRYATIDSDSR